MRVRAYCVSDSNSIWYIVAACKAFTYPAAYMPKSARQNP